MGVSTCRESNLRVQSGAPSGQEKVAQIERASSLGWYGVCEGDWGQQGHNGDESEQMCRANHHGTDRGAGRRWW